MVESIDLSAIKKHIEDLKKTVQQANDETNLPKWWEAQDKRINSLESRMNTTQSPNQMNHLRSRKQICSWMTAVEQRYHKEPLLMNDGSFGSLGSVTTRPRIELPIFEGTNPKRWIQKCIKIFPFYGVTAEKRVVLAAMHFGRFNERTFPKIMEEFSKLLQKCSVDEYKDKFEELKPYILIQSPTLREDFLLSIFVSGLKEDLEMVSTQLLAIIVANGEKVFSSTRSNQVSWTIQGFHFNHDFRILQLGGSDMVLGVDWMKQFSLVLIDCKDMTSSFQKDGKLMIMQGQTTMGNWKSIPGNRMQKMTAKDSSLMDELYVLDVDPVASTVPIELEPLLQEFDSIFDEPTGLPPIKVHDHPITLIPGSLPVNLRPYRFTHHQKNEVEKQITQMLTSSIIQASKSPFASRYLLVKKKNDLRLGNWKIRIQPQDTHKTAFRTHHEHFKFKDMLKVPVLYIIGAFIPATMIAVLYYFDHSVASQLAQQKEFNLRKPPSFHYDLLLGFFMILCGLIGIPPANGVIPQSPMHTKSLSPLVYQEPVARGLNELKASAIQMASSMGNIDASVDEIVFDVEKESDDLLPIEVKEQRLSTYEEDLLAECQRILNDQPGYLSSCVRLLSLDKGLFSNKERQAFQSEVVSLAHSEMKHPVPLDVSSLITFSGNPGPSSDLTLMATFNADGGGKLRSSSDTLLKPGRNTITYPLPPQKTGSYVLSVLTGHIGHLAFRSHNFSKAGPTDSDDFMSYEKTTRPILKVSKPRPLVDLSAAISSALLINEAQWIGIIVQPINYSLKGDVLNVVEVILANADLMRLGHVSRVHPRDHFNHVILGVVGSSKGGGIVTNEGEEQNEGFISEAKELGKSEKWLGILKKRANPTVNSIGSPPEMSALVVTRE
ncbi:hypothetical protein F3Y22_tig00112507pilonHSYRG00213 [Hibiscus syriacus]|uniref:Bicarbonate transporter-like transmembrane domain-containing protein n=1 Tax=Hibiscus syriacus TaxID=106335 RepID=A0A6A2WWL5_HIBSY|nr:hypothetical protein F3Y22_tig00112507pilonHSYRG00213 [Hibiscus syriacus]